MRILAFETSCDDTAAAVVEDGRRVLASVTASQDRIHSEYGGVVPEIASREHDAHVAGVYEEALSRAGCGLDQIDAVAVTRGPGLIGSLLVGVSFGKALAFSRGLPFTGVSHLAGHLYSPFIGRPDIEPPAFEPHLGLIASGGHTALYSVRSPVDFHLIGPTLDDAVGEAFDKVAKFLGLPYPGGPALEREATSWQGPRIEFPIPVSRGNPLAFSFSGLKTAIIQYIRREESRGVTVPVPQVAASFQHTVFQTLLGRLLLAAEQEGVSLVTFTGGVAANRTLREGLHAALAEKGIRLVVPAREYCTDNAAMIGGVAFHYLRNGMLSDAGLNAVANMAEGC